MPSTGFLRVKNFDRFQHYKDRTPPWIKLYNDLLDDYDFSCLPDAEKWGALQGAFRGNHTEASAYVVIPGERVSSAEWRELRLLIFQRDGYRCQYCGTGEGPMECDHVFPRSRGGADTMDNLRTACRRCNRSKNDRTVEEWKGGPN